MGCGTGRGGATLGRAAGAKVVGAGAPGASGVAACHGRRTRTITSTTMASAAATNASARAAPNGRGSGGPSAVVTYANPKTEHTRTTNVVLSGTPPSGGRG